MNETQGNYLVSTDFIQKSGVLERFIEWIFIFELFMNVYYNIKINKNLFVIWWD